MTDPGTKVRNFVPDYQPANALNHNGATQGFYPHSFSAAEGEGRIDRYHAEKGCIRAIELLDCFAC